MIVVPVGLGISPCNFRVTLSKYFENLKKTAFVAEKWLYSNPDAKEKGLPFPVTTFYYWWAVTGSNRGPTD
jgi:hypothetical protein